MQIQKEADKTVFVANLGSSANEEILFELFLQVGSYFPQALKLDEINGIVVKCNKKVVAQQYNVLSVKNNSSSVSAVSRLHVPCFIPPGWATEEGHHRPRP